MAQMIVTAQMPAAARYMLKRSLWRRALMAAVVVASSVTCRFVTPPAVAQSVIAAPPAAVVDESGYDNVSRQVEAHVTDVTIGSGDFQLNHNLHAYGSSLDMELMRDSFYGNLQPTGQTIYGGLGGTVFTSCGFQFSYSAYSDCFDVNGSVYAPRSQNGSMLNSNPDGTWTYTARDGVVFSIFGFQPANSPGYQFGAPGFVTKISYPTGLIININWKFWSGSSGRVQSVTSNAGMQIKYTFLSDITPTSSDTSNLANWLKKTGVRAINNQAEYCDPLGDACNTANAWKSASYAWSGYIDNGGTQPHTMLQLNVTAQDGLVTRFTLLGGATQNVPLATARGGQIVGIKPPTSSVDIFTFTYCNVFSGVDYPYSPYCTFPLPGNYIDSPNNSGNTAPIRSGVASYTKEGRAFHFVLSAASNGNGAGSTTYGDNLGVDPDGRHTDVSLINYVSPSLGSFPSSVTLPNGTGYSYAGDLTGRIVSYSNGQSATFDYQYDSRGNITNETRTPPGSSGVPALVTAAAYVSSCGNIVTCNKPTSVTDPRGNVTQYSYDPVHGGVLTVTPPADANGVTPQTRYVYAQLSAQVRNSSNALVAASPIWVLVQESRCKTGAATGAGCAVPGDEVRKTYQYGPASGPQDLFLHGIVDDATGLGTRVCFSYDLNGNRVSETKPNAQLAACP
jgi:YD repeat-containing protein